MSALGAKVVPDTKNVNGYIIPSFKSSDLELKIQNMIPNPGDIILTGYPKCGNTWMANIIGILLRKGAVRNTSEDYIRYCPAIQVFGLETLEQIPRPRCYRVHYNYDRVPKCPGAKYIVIVRNPKDCLTSMYHFIKNDVFGFRDGDFQVLFDLFMKGEVMYNDYFEHTMSWYEHRKDPNVLFLYYEKVKEDKVKAIQDIATFMGPEFFEIIKDGNVLNSVVEQSSFENMKSGLNQTKLSIIRSDGKETPNSAVALFSAIKEATSKGSRAPFNLTRKGIVGDWRNLFSNEQSKLMDAMIEEKMKGTEMYHYWKSIGCI